MFFFRRPSVARVRALLDTVRDRPLAYPEVGATAHELPSGYRIDRYGSELGTGEATYRRAKRAVGAFAMYPPGWTRVVADPGPIAAGRAFATLIRHLGFWSANPCKVVYIIDDSGDDASAVQRGGFAFGTLPGHAELGEERFEVSFDPESRIVRFSVVAFSKPHAALARLGAPIARAYQRRFQRDACAAMLRGVASDARGADTDS